MKRNPQLTFLFGLCLVAAEGARYPLFVGKPYLTGLGRGSPSLGEHLPRWHVATWNFRR